ncbi:MAG TPA: AEC family transporter [Acetobacteraceae bacterium]|jgi:predicted permease|nr:AEC family transporter [Acetobacteraceae bacterium]
MCNILLLFLCLAAGVALRASGRVPDNAHQAINGVIINIALPALTLLQIHGIRLHRDLLFPILMPWLMFAGVSTGIWLVARKMRLAIATTGALILTAGLANTSFVGVPMIESFYGSSYMSIGLLIDQLGTYLVLSTLGITIACLCSRGTASVSEIARRVATFPPLIALVLALLLMPITYPPIVNDILQRLGNMLAPLALVSVGLQLRLGVLRGRLSPLVLGLGVKLVLAPLLLAIVYLELLGQTGNLARVTLFESAMGPQIGGAIVATQYGLDPPLVTLMVGIGSVIAFVTLPMWWYFLRGA